MKSTIRMIPKIEPLLLSRAQIGFSTVELADKAGVHFTTICGIESGKNVVVLPKTARKIAKALNKPLDELFDFNIGPIKGAK